MDDKKENKAPVIEHGKPLERKDIRMPNEERKPNDCDIKKVIKPEILDI